MAVKPKLAMIPSGVGIDTLYSVLPADGTGDFTFDRNLNTATRINKDGLIEMVDADVPRLNYPLIDGVVSGCPSLLLEPERRNLVTYSEDFSQALYAKTNGTVTTNTAISPDGTQNADTWTATGVSATLQGLAAITSGVQYTVSIYLKRKTGTGQVSLRGVSNTSTPITITDEWQRYSVTLTSTDTNGRFGVNLLNSGDEVYVWGAQLEAGSYPTSYIPSLTGSQTTRSAETCNNSGDANTFNDSEGVLMVEISAFAETGRIALNDGTTNNNVRLVYDATNVIYAILFNGTNQAFLTYTLPIEGGFNKIAFKYKASDFALWVDGIEVDSQVGSGTTFTSGTLSELDFDAGSNGLVPFYGNIKQLQYFDTALSDEELALLTKI